MYHSLSIGEALKKLNASEDGLSGKEAERRLAEDGRNELPE